MANHRIHKDMSFDGYIKNPPKSEEAMKKLLSDIIERIGMKVAKLSNDQPNPIAWYCDDPDNRGMTAFGILTTSDIRMHIWDAAEPYEIHFGLYSCSDYDPSTIVEILNKEFGIIQGGGLVLDRKTGNFNVFDVKPQVSQIIPG